MKLTSLEPRQETKWRLAGWITLSVTITLSALTGLMLAWTIAPAYFNESSTGYVACLPNGAPYFYWSPESANIWNPDLFLSITLGFGPLTFTQAKAIDIIWDLFVGRGTQVILIFISYPILRRALLLSLERGPVSFPLYSSLTLERISLRSLIALCVPSGSLRPSKAGQRLPVRKRWSWNFFAMFLVLGWLLIYPTIMSVMTGYQASLQPYVVDPTDNSSIVAIQDMYLPPYIVMDGSRVNLSAPYFVEAEFVDFTPAYYDYDTWVTCAYALVRREAFVKLTDTRTDYEGLEIVAGNITRGVYGSLEANTTVTTETLGYIVDGGKSNFSMTVPPRATSTAQIASTIILSGHNWTLPAPPLNIVSNGLNNEIVYVGSNVTYNQSWISNNTICEPETSYQWGFSFLMLFTFLIAFCLFLITLVALHWSVYDYSRADRFKQPISVYRDVLDLAAELKAQLGDETMDLPADKLHDEVVRFGSGIQFDVEGLPPSRKEEKKARKRNKKKSKMGSVSYVPVEEENVSYDNYKTAMADDAIPLQSLDSDQNRLMHRDDVRFAGARSWVGSVLTKGKRTLGV